MSKILCKLIALSLCALMLIPLAACSQAPAIPEEYEKLISYLDRGKYDKAIEEIEKMMPAGTTPTPAPSAAPSAKPSAAPSASPAVSSAPVSPITPPPSPSPAVTSAPNYDKSGILGEWICADGEDRVVFSDSSVTLPDGSSCSWALTKQNSGYVGDDPENPLYTFTVLTYMSDYGRSYRAMRFNSSKTFFECYPERNLEIIELTMDNFYDYFELQEHVEHYDDAFGDLASWSITWSLQLKEEYASRIQDDGFVVFGGVDYTRSYTEHALDFDPESDTYTDLGLTDDQFLSGSRTDIAQFTGSGYPSITVSYTPLQVHNSPDYDEQTGLFTCTYFVDDVTVNRVTGTLYLLKNR